MPNHSKKSLIGLLLLVCTLWALPGQADTTQMNATLVRMINQLDALLPMIDQAQQAQDPSARVQFHFNTWVDAKGQQHAGLRQDILRIRQALEDQINQTDLTPKTITPINGDFTGR